MTFITDRTENDVLQRNEKGVYSHEDLNRVESAVAAIAHALKQQGVDLGLAVKTDWAVAGVYTEDNWPTQTQMDRYLGNVKAIKQHFGISVWLPDTLQYLTWEKANAIEQVLQQAWAQVFPTQGKAEEAV